MFHEELGDGSLFGALASLWVRIFQERFQICFMVVSGFDLTIGLSQEVLEVWVSSVSCHMLPVKDW